MLLSGKRCKTKIINILLLKIRRKAKVISEKYRKNIIIGEILLPGKYYYRG